MMDGVVWNSQYFDPSAPDAKQMLPATGMRYIATREGAHIISPEEETAMELKNNFNYIARRKGVAHVDGERDGLFNAFGKADLSDECEKAAQSGSIFWKNVLSLSKEDVDRLGYTDVDAFRQLLARRMPEVAREYNISPQNLVWVAAYHPIDKNGSDHHPHVHVYFYSKDPSEGRMSPERTVKAFEKCRSIFTNDVFAEDTELLKEQRTLARNELRRTLLDYRFNTEAADALGIREDLRQLARELPASGRKGSYKYCKPEVKEKVDALLKKMVCLPGVDSAYTAYRDAYLAQVKLYNSTEGAVAKRMDAFDKDFFHPTTTNARRDFHNAILRLAREVDGVEVSLARRDIGEPSAEMKQFVGLSAREALVSAQTDNGYRQWLGRLYAEYGVSELPELMKAAQRENWRELYRSVRQATRENPQLSEALVKECRLYLTADEQATGAYEGDRLYQGNVTETTADGVRAEAQRILHMTRNVADGTEDYVCRLFYENALDRRLQGWFQDHVDLVGELRRETGLTMCCVDDKRHPCPKAISDAAYAAASEMLIQIANDDPALRKERDLFMVRSLKSDDFNGMDRVLNAALHTAYRQEISEQLRQFYHRLPEHRETLETLSAEIRCGTTYDELTADQKQRIAVFLPTVPMDANARKLFTEHTMRVIEEQRLQQILAVPPAVMDDVIQQIGMRQDVTDLQDDPTVQKMLEPIKAIVCTEPEVADADPKTLERVLIGQATRENRQAFADALYTPEARTIFAEQSRYISIGQPLDAMPPHVRRSLERFFVLPSDGKGDEWMVREIERRLYNERFRALAQSPDVRQILSEYIRDPHHRSLLERGVRFDELTPADREAVSTARSWIGNREIDGYAKDHPEDVDRAFYRAAQQQYHEEQRMEHGVRGLIGGLITATAIARQAMMQHAQDQQMRERQAQREEKKRRNKKKPNKRQERSRRDLIQP